MKRWASLLLLVLLLGGSCGLLQAQQNIEPRLLYADSVRYPFSSEWQYLSTDIFLFHPQRFNRVINETEFNDPRLSKRARRNRLVEDRLEYLFVTASLKNVRFFGDAEMVYPLYNFRVQADADARYQLYTSDNIEHVRVLDNLPLYSAANAIDAEIRVHAITSNSRDMMLGLIARSLKNISKLTSPASVVMGLIGEFGNLLESNTKQKEYRFSSTIRLFEQKNFDVQLHSIKVYALETRNSKGDTVDAQALRAFLDTVGPGFITRRELAALLPYERYPLVVVMNYKSVYRMEPVSGDEVTYATIDKRKLKVENDFRQGLINEDTYRQERDFSDFLTIFANLKSHIDAYRLNSRTGNTDAVAGALFNIMQHYRALLKHYQEMGHKYAGKSAFTTVFAPEYESVLGFAALYLDDDHNLKATKELVQTLLALAGPTQTMSIDEMENAVAALRFSEQFKPEMMKSQPVGQEIEAMISHLENALYDRVYSKEVAHLEQTQANHENKNAPQRLLTLLKNTSCGSCRERAFEAVSAFGQRMGAFYRREAIQRRDSVVNAVMPWLYRQVDSVAFVKSQFDSIFGLDTIAERTGYLRRHIETYDNQLETLKELIQQPTAEKNLQDIDQLTERIIEYRRRAEESLRVIREMEPRLWQRAAPPIVEKE